MAHLFLFKFQFVKSVFWDFVVSEEKNFANNFSAKDKLQVFRHSNVDSVIYIEDGKNNKTSVEINMLWWKLFIWMWISKSSIGKHL